nr:hypothetical protein [Candidatus Babeliales bacterium]
MVQNEKICCLTDVNPVNNIFFFTVTVPKKITESLIQLAVKQQQALSNLSGFKKGVAPVSYIQEHFKNPIISHIKDLGLKFFGLKTLLSHIRAEKLVLVGVPQLKNISLDVHGNALYSFEGFTTKELYMQSWKYLPFKATPRKKYRDIDKQVLSFLQEEEELAKRYNPNHGVCVGDWICVKAWIVDGNKGSLFQEHALELWLRIGDEEPDLEFQKIFLGKKIGEQFITDNIGLQKYFCENSTSNYQFLIEMFDIVPHKSFNFEIFKNYFRIKTNKDLLTKITEVFSFNNDISQRRSIAYEALGIIIKKNQIVLPDAAIHVQKKLIIQDLQSKSDFMVYKQDPQFDVHVMNMAKRQLLDSVVVEHIAYQDNIAVVHHDVKTMLQFTQRPRLKDFLYFPFIKSQFEGQE